MAQATSAENKTAIIEFLRSKNLSPSQAWINNFFSAATAKTNIPLPAQQQTALFRLLSTDLTKSVQPGSSPDLLPTNVSDPQVKAIQLKGPITVQVLDIEDVGRSRWSQVEAIEAYERGEMTKGREIIRIVSDEDSNNHMDSSGAMQAATPSTGSTGPHKLLLQDAKGTKVYGFELVPVPGVGIEKLAIGAKLVLRNVNVARGVLMLEPKGVEVLGGKVEAWDKAWRAGRKEVLKRMAKMGSEGGDEGG